MLKGAASEHALQLTRLPMGRFWKSRDVGAGWHIDLPRCTAFLTMKWKSRINAIIARFTELLELEDAEVHPKLVEILEQMLEPIRPGQFSFWIQNLSQICADALYVNPYGRNQVRESAGKI